MGRLDSAAHGVYTGRMRHSIVLPDDLSTQLALAARVEGCDPRDVIANALRAHLERLRSDAAFQTRLVAMRAREATAMQQLGFAPTPTASPTTAPMGPSPASAQAPTLTPTMSPSLAAAGFDE